MKNEEPQLKNKNLLQQRSFEFSKSLIACVSNLPNSKVYWVITDQLLRAGISIGANIVEAQAASSKRDFVKFFQIALKSANETCYWLLLLKDAPKENVHEVELLIQECEELCKMLGASLITMKGKRDY